MATMEELQARIVQLEDDLSTARAQVCSQHAGLRSPLDQPAETQYYRFIRRLKAPASMQKVKCRYVQHDVK